MQNHSSSSINLSQYVREFLLSIFVVALLSFFTFIVPLLIVNKIYPISHSSDTQLNHIQEHFDTLEKDRKNAELNTVKLMPADKFKSFTQQTEHISIDKKIKEIDESIKQDQLSHIKNTDSWNY